MPNQQHVTHTPPCGILQDAGELAVLTEREGTTRHRYAMVVAFTNEEDLKRAIAEHRCAYRDGQAIQEAHHHG